MHLAFRFGIYLLLIIGILCLDRPAKRYSLVWSDEFDGTEVDASKWTFLLGDGCNIGLCGWGNGELQWYTNSTENAFVENGRLVIQAKQDYKDSLPGVQRSYSSARMVTKGKGDFKFARIEVRAKFPSSKGIWPLIWMLPSYEKYGIWPNSGELDIAVMPSPSLLYTQAIYGRTYKDFSNPKKSPSTDVSSFTEKFHKFVVEWREDNIAWIIDNVLVHNFSKAQVSSIDNYPFNEKYHFILCMAVGGNVVGSPSASLFPRRLEVDYIRVYQYF